LPQTADINQRIFDNSIDLILVVDHYGNFIRVSPSSFDIIGYAPDELVGHLASEFLYPPDLDRTREMMRQSRRGNVTRHFTCRYVHKNGNIITLAWTGMWSEVAQQHFFIGRDITAVKTLETIEEDLAAALEQLQSLSWSHTTLKLADYCWALELTIAIDSLWGAWVLFTGPSNFRTFTDTFALAARIENNEMTWALASLIAAVMIFCGGAATWWQVRPRWAIVLRSFGLIIAGAFWFCLGVSTVAGNPDSLFGMKGVTGGAVAYMIALRLLLFV